MDDLDYTITYTGTSDIETFYLEISADGTIAVDGFGAEDSVVLYDTEYDYEYIYSYAYAERQLGSDYDLKLTTNDDGDEEILIYTNSAEEGDIASYDELFAVLTTTDDVTYTATEDVDTFVLTPTASDGVVTINDFGVEDYVEIDGWSYSADNLVAYGYAGRHLGASAMADMTIDEDGNGQITLYANSADEDEVIAVYDEAFAVINVDMDEYSWVT